MAGTSPAKGIRRGNAWHRTFAPVSPTGHFTPRNEWLARVREEIIEPDLPIVDPHHHLVERPETGRYLLPELLADTNSGHNIIATVYLEWLSMYRADGPAEMKPVGEVEFANGVAAMAASGAYGKTQCLRRHRRLCRPGARRRGRKGAGGADRGRRRAGRPVQGHPLHLGHRSGPGGLGFAGVARRRAC